MTAFPPELLGLFAATFLVAGVVKGVTGIGLPTASVGILSQIIDPRLAISLVIFPSLLSNAWQIWRAGGMTRVVRDYWAFLACLMGFIALISTTVTGAVPIGTLMLVLGSVVVAFSAMSLAWEPPHLPARWDRAGQLVAGTAAGVLGGLTAIWAPPMVTYLMARRVQKDDFVRATGVMIFLGTLPLIGGFWSSGLLTGPIALVSTAMIVPALIGFTLGERLRKRLDTERFRKVVLLVFLVMGLNLIRRALV